MDPVCLGEIVLQGVVEQAHSSGQDGMDVVAGGGHCAQGFQVFLLDN